MGSGKSTTARQLSSQLGWINVDLDKRITDAAGQSIPEIFAKKGEAEFRRLEHEQLARLIAEAIGDQKPRIVSLGGGTIAQPQNLALLIRCAQITDRPLFRDEASFRRLYQERLPFYQMADFRVDSSAPPARLVEQILSLDVFGKVTV
jgi:shikimate kinase